MAAGRRPVILWLNQGQRISEIVARVGENAGRIARTFATLPDFQGLDEMDKAAHCLRESGNLRARPD